MYTVLVLDEDPLMLKMLHKALTLLGFEAETAQTPVQAMEMLGGNTFHAVIAETCFHSGVGIELLRDIRKSCPSIYIVALTTGNGLALDKASTGKIREYGADFVLCKPVEMHQLERSLEALHSIKPLS